MGQIRKPFLKNFSIHVNRIFLIVGSGFFGSTIAHCLADADQDVVLLDRRTHIGGNSFSSREPRTGIEIHRYGSHIFHTRNEKVWNFINQFASFNNYRHSVLTTYQDKVYHFTPNLQTLSEFYNVIGNDPQKAKLLLAEFALKYPNPRNLYEKGCALVGEKLFKALYAGYTEKQWQTPLEQLPASIINRLPLHLDHRTNYFDDPHQGIPKFGYGDLFQKMLDHPRISCILGKTYREFLRTNGHLKNMVTIYTGPLDEFFFYCFGKLGWRSVRFDESILNIPDFQGTSVMNYADASIPFTRIHEFKHFEPERHRALTKTVIWKEFPQTPQNANDCYYPIRSARDVALYAKYRARVPEDRDDFYIGGRLAEYKYYDMDATIASALSLFEKLKANYRL